jgi:hypothetical protein
MTMAVAAFPPALVEALMLPDLISPLALLR